MIRRPPRSTLFPSTTLSRSSSRRRPSCSASTANELSSVASSRAAASFSDRKSTRLNSSHERISYAVFCLKKELSPVSSEYDWFLNELEIANFSDFWDQASLIFFIDTAPTEIYTLSQHDALPI